MTTAAGIFRWGYRILVTARRRLASSRKATLGAAIVLGFVLLGLLAPVISPGDPSAVVGAENLPPSLAHLLGTTGAGNDVFAQVVWGARNSLAVGFLTGSIITVIGVAVGLTAAFFGRWVDYLLTLLTNVFLVIPGLPLLVVMAAFLPRSTFSIVFVLSIAGWPSSARVLRSQALSIVRRDYVAAATVIGERPFRVIVVEVLPNLSSLIASVLFSSVGYGIGALAALQFLGLGNIALVSWGSILYWAQNNAALLLGAWWQFVPAGLCLAITCAAISMLNFAIDEVTNPRLRTVRESRRWGILKPRRPQKEFNVA